MEGESLIGHRVAKAKAKLARDLYASGWEVAAIAEQIDRSPRWVRQKTLRLRQTEDLERARLVKARAKATRYRPQPAGEEMPRIRSREDLADALVRWGSKRYQ